MHLLADSAEAHQDGTIDVHRGAVTAIHAPSWPAKANISIVTRLELTMNEAVSRPEMELEILYNGRRLVGTIKSPLRVKVVDLNVPIFVNIIGALEFLVPGEGELTFVSGLGRGKQLPDLRMQAVTQPGTQLNPQAWGLR